MLKLIIGIAEITSIAVITVITELKALEYHFRWLSYQSQFVMQMTGIAMITPKADTRNIRISQCYIA